MNQQALQDVWVAAQIGAAHAACVIDMGEGAFDSLAALAHQIGDHVDRAYVGDCRTLPTNHDYAVSTREYQSDQPSHQLSRLPSMLHCLMRGR